MRNDIAGPETESTMPMWEGLEGVVREKAQEFIIQQILEEEVTELLGRPKSERQAAVDAAPGYRNGYGKARRLSMSSGTITVRRPRVRGLEERFESRVLPLFARRTEEVGELIPELYLHGLAEGDFELALRGLLGEGAPLSGRPSVTWDGRVPDLAAWAVARAIGGTPALLGDARLPDGRPVGERVIRRLEAALKPPSRVGIDGSGATPRDGGRGVKTHLRPNPYQALGLGGRSHHGRCRPYSAGWPGRGSARRCRASG